MWITVKRKHKKQGGFSRPLLTLCLEEYMRRQAFGDEPSKNLVLHINFLYPIQ